MATKKQRAAKKVQKLKELKELWEDEGKRLKNVSDEFNRIINSQKPKNVHEYEKALQLLHSAEKAFKARNLRSIGSRDYQELVSDINSQAQRVEQNYDSAQKYTLIKKFEELKKAGYITDVEEIDKYASAALVEEILTEAQLKREVRNAEQKAQDLIEKMQEIQRLTKEEVKSITEQLREAGF